MIIETRSPEMTYRLGEAIGRQVKPGDIICLNGDLGVGKTVLHRDWLWDLELMNRYAALHLQ